MSDVASAQPGRNSGSGERPPEDSSESAAAGVDAGEVVAVVGAGAMGSGIAQVAALAGHETYLVDMVAGAADAAVERLVATLNRLAEKGHLSPEAAGNAAARLHTEQDVEALPPCGVVIEAIAENLGAKRALFEQLAATQSPETVLASNTSSLDIDAIAGDVPHPGRVIGLHFFNPAARMRLVEVISGARSDEAALRRGEEYVRAWGKTTVRCTSTPGFIVNRVARPFYGEAQRMVAEGIADAATIDLALRGAGFAMGPLELTDLIGQDVNLAVGTSVWEQTDRDPRYEPTQAQRDLVAAGQLGRKTGRGVFTYVDGKATDAVPDERRARELVGGPVRTDPVARTVAMLVNEAVDLVARGEASAADVDVAMQLGTNYPRGPIEWGREIGLATVAAQLAELDAAYPGGRYRPSPALTSPPNPTDSTDPIDAPEGA
ncbi:3-hydroxybutyryl-CoA dehydrogenase [Kineosphaera limosa]|nr:3-hydroxyacyl-CoA dehydrogenase NAD-binding domain-containing protein [Kineosphaera limosa]NYE01524.1 3-hydroxybutyryl-CoA dehydrogenase [Kineosphaera limosa]